MQDIAEGDLKREFLRGQRTCVVCWGDGSERRLENATHMVMLDPRGYPLDVLRLPQLSGRIPVSPSLAVSLTEDDRKVEDVRKVVEFLDKHWPHLIVVGTASPECRQLQADLEKICDVEFTQASSLAAIHAATAYPCPCCKQAWRERVLELAGLS